MWIDPIIEELHNIREAHAARFNNDLNAIVADLKQLEQDWSGPKINLVSKLLDKVNSSNQFHSIN
jgi:hypothetical protein